MSPWGRSFLYVSIVSHKMAHGSRVEDAKPLNGRTQEELIKKMLERNSIKIKLHTAKNN